MVVSSQCEGYYTTEPGEVIHQGRGKCQKCSRAEELLNRQSLEEEDSSFLTFQNVDRKYQEASK